MIKSKLPEEFYDYASMILPAFIEKYFPKDKCKERGEAIVLCAELIFELKRFLENDNNSNKRHRKKVQ